MDRMKGSLEQVIEIIVHGVNPDKIILFGSRARGENHEESDYDLCVLKTDVGHRRKLAKQIYRSLYGSGLAVDVIVETPQRFEELKEDPFLIYKEIGRGKVIYEKSG